MNLYIKQTRLIDKKKEMLVYIDNVRRRRQYKKSLFSIDDGRDGNLYSINIVIYVLFDHSIIDLPLFYFWKYISTLNQTIN